MSWYGSRLPDFVTATTEHKLKEELAAISLGIGEKLEIMTIYPRGGKIYAWYFLDMSKVDKLPPKKTTKKKVSKKVS